MRCGMPALRRLAYVTLFSLGSVVPAAGQARTATPVIPVSVVRVPRAQLADTGASVTLVLRSLAMFGMPERPLDEARILFAAAGTDPRAHPEGILSTDVDGKAKILHIVHDSLEVEVLRVGFGAARFSIEVAKGCRQTVEVYVEWHALIDVEAGGPPPPHPHAVQTTCAP